MGPISAQSDFLANGLVFGGKVKATGLERVSIRQRPKLLTDNGPCYASSELRAWLEDNTVRHTRGQPYHPQTQETIERWHRTLKDRILLEHDDLPGELERQITDFVHYYKTRRYHAAVNTTVVCYLGR